MTAINHDLIQQLLQKRGVSTLPALLVDSEERHPNPVLFSWKEHNRWHSYSSEQFLEQVEFMTLGLRALGLKPGERVGLLGKSCPQWLVADFGVQCCQAVSVPFLPKISYEHFEFEVRDAAPKFCFCFDEVHWDTLEPLIPAFERVFPYQLQRTASNCMRYEDIIALGKSEYEKDPKAFTTMLESLDGDATISLLYTSGTTGVPKGVMLSHKNILTQALGGAHRLKLHPINDRALSALPLAHVFERSLTYFYLSAGVSIYFCDDVQRLRESLHDARPTIMAVVPRLLEKVLARMEMQVMESRFIKRKIGQWAFALARSENTSFWTRCKLWLADKLVYSKLREAMGGNFRQMLSGAAALRPELARIFLHMGIPIYEGYGLTESSPTIALNYEGHHKLGTVGPAFPGVEIRVSADGEVLARGDSIMKGYYRRPEETEKAIDREGWFHTGDLGRVDAEGFLTITGRKKEIYKTSNGKMVCPVPIELELNLHVLIDMSLLVAEGRPYVTALLYPDFEVLDKMKKAAGYGDMTAGAFLHTPEVQTDIKNLLDQVNSRHDHWANVAAYRWVLTVPSVDGGELTPTLKMRRENIVRKNAELINQMYKKGE